MSTTTDVIAERLTQLRCEHDMTQHEMSEFLQLSRGRYANWETAYRSPKFDEVAMIADRLGVSPAWLVGWSDDRQNSIAVGSRYITAGRHTISTSAGSARIDNTSSDTAYSVDYLTRRGLKETQCLSIRNNDDAMTGICARGDEVLIDRSQQTPNGTDLYAILIDDQAVVRWVERHPDGSASVKDERSAEPWKADEISKIRIIGRVSRIAHDR